MCKLASFWHNPSTGDIAVSILDQHDETAKALKLNEKVWREGHYLPSGEIECRVAPEDHITQEECNARLKSRFPTFVYFLSWALEEICKNGKYDGSLYLSSLTSAAGLKLPREISGSLDLRSLTSAAGLKLPEKCGYLDLSSLTSAAGLKLPREISGYLYLSSEVKAEYQAMIDKMKDKASRRKAKSETKTGTSCAKAEI